MTQVPAPELPLDVAAIRADFPLLADGGYTFLDTAASAQKPAVVLDAVREIYSEHYANVHRGVYSLSREATERYEAVRGIVQRHLNAPSAREVVFTSGTTESINLVAYSWGLSNLGPGDIVVVSELDHHAMFVPWQRIAERTGAAIRYIPVDASAQLQLDSLDGFASEGRVRMLGFAHVSNSAGTINPVREITDWARRNDALTIVDGAQAAPHMRVDVQDLGCDFYAFSGHKAAGPAGVGVLWGRAELLGSMEPFLYGGEMIRSVTTEGTTFNDLPWKFEAGTPAFPEIVGMGAAIEYLAALGFDRIAAHEAALTGYLHARLAEFDDIEVVGPAAGHPRAGLVSFTMAGAHPHDIAEILDRSNICIRAGHHCTQPLMRALGLAATARASVYVYNDATDIDRFVAALDDVRSIFGGRH